MKYYNKILEAVNKGIQIALDDFEDNEPNSSLSQQSDVIDSEDVIKYRMDLIKEVVDLGLPSGTLWCKYNLGVDQNQLSEPEDWYGDYYAWGELEPNKTFKDFIYFYYDNYKWYDKQSTKYTKYNKQDNLTKLLPEDDVAYQNKHVGNYKFHIPTKEQCEELINYAKGYWVKNYDPNKIKHNSEDDKGIQGLNGALFISKINNEELFIPDASYHDMENHGHTNDPYFNNKQYSSIFWTACPNLSNCGWAWAYIFYSIDNILYGGSSTKMRWSGLPIRPVINL